MKTASKLFYFLAIAVFPAGVSGFSTGPVIKRTGALVDGGLDCSACHRTYAPANSDPLGKVTITADPYKPGIKQFIHVTVFHPEAQRWGFQLTARPLNDETKMAGTFSQTAEVQVKCDGTGVYPCGGPLEFAEHTVAATLTGANGSKTFEIEWTPPGTEVGGIVLYAAGNAANNNGANTGDRIYTTSLVIRPADGICNLTTKPQLVRVTDAAAFKPGVAMNSLFTLFGSNLYVPGLTRTAGAGDIQAGRFPSQLGCIAVEVAGQRVPITYLQRDQINAQVPALTNTGSVEVRVIANPGAPNELRSDVATVQILNFAPAFFTYSGTQSIAAQIGGTATLVADPAVIPSGRPARPGEVVTLYLTGLGPTDPVYQAGEIIASDKAPKLRVPNDLTVTIGGTTVPAADVLYAGITPGSISGLYQINVKIPASASTGDLPVAVRIGGVDSAAGATIPVRVP